MSNLSPGPRVKRFVGACRSAGSSAFVTVSVWMLSYFAGAEASEYFWGCWVSALKLSVLQPAANSIAAEAIPVVRQRKKRFLSARGTELSIGFSRQTDANRHQPDASACG